MENNPSKAFLEKKAILDQEQSLIQIKHSFKMLELQTERENFHEGHLERMSEIRLKNANIQRSINKVRRDFTQRDG